MASQEALEKQKSPSGVFSYSPSGVFSGPFSLVDRKGFLNIQIIIQHGIYTLEILII